VFPRGKTPVRGSKELRKMCGETIKELMEKEEGKKKGREKKKRKIIKERKEIRSICLLNMNSYRR
jgi:hypothetical protein